MVNNHYIMKKTGLIILLSFTSLFAMAQADTTYRQLPVAKEGAVLFLVNGIIVSDMWSISPSGIKTITVLKVGSGMPANIKNLSKYGVILITTKKKIKLDTKKISDFKKWLHINEDVQYALDGFYVDDENLKIATTSINEIDILKKNDEDKLPVTVINIWTLAPRQRGKVVYGGHKPTDKPGVIYIRG
jgi:hypothetical protein